MTRKNNAALLEEAAVALEKQSAELSKLKASTRGERLRKSETELKNAAKPKTRAGRGVALRRVEAEIVASKRDGRLVYHDMKVS
jgi:hypothetical protein